MVFKEIEIHCTFVFIRRTPGQFGMNIAHVVFFELVHENIYCGVVALITGSKGIYNDDDLCLFRCLAVHRGAPVSDVESPAKTYFHQYLQHTTKSPNKFKAVAIEDLQNIETL
jgi:hypothetical protein